MPTLIRLICLLALIASLPLAASCKVMQQSANTLHYKAFASQNNNLPTRHYHIDFVANCSEPLQAIRIDEPLIADQQVQLPSMSQPQPRDGVLVQLHLNRLEALAADGRLVPLSLLSASSNQVQTTQVKLITGQHYKIHSAGQLSADLEYRGQLTLTVSGRYQTNDLKQLTLPVRLVFNPDQ